MRVSFCKENFYFEPNSFKQDYYLLFFYREVSCPVYGSKLTEANIFRWQDDVNYFTGRRGIVYFVDVLLKIQ